MASNCFFKSLVSTGLLVVFLSVNITSADELRTASGPSHTLSPDTSFTPLVTIKSVNGGYTVVENTDTEMVDKGLPGSRFRDDVAFIYVSQLIGQALTLDIGIDVLTELIEEHLSYSSIYCPHLLDRYGLDRMFQENGIYCLPYTRSDDPSREQLLRYYLPDGGKAP
ncbi:MAG: hypothetical protein GF392_06005, partial [Candidatus Omnitrophica bacterium]|nr:hypothetical protein [Candidatus Omnitrophota bacterium]